MSPGKLQVYESGDPTGALQSDRAPSDTVPAVTITLADNGPLMVRGPVRIVDSSGAVISEVTRVALCRCGRSANIPFCDGSHGPARFRPSR